MKLKARNPPPPPPSFSLQVVDYHHVSSVAVGPSSNLIVASRNLNAVWSLAADGSGASWVLSSSLTETDDDDAGDPDVEGS